MPLTPLPGEGIELPLSEYTRLRAFQGGGWFWDHENQQVIRAELGAFLPRVEERARGTAGGAAARFQHFVGGAEVAGKSDPVGASMNRVPRAEYQRLQRALEALKRKSEDPHTDPTARRIIEKFCLPDPAQNPDLYRLHGSAWNRRLLVLWGCEKEQGTSLAPVAALHKLSVEPPAASLLRRLPLLLGLLLLLLLLTLLAHHFWPRQAESSRENSPAALADASVTPSLTGNAASPGSPALPGNDAAATAPVPAKSGPLAPLASGGSSPVAPVSPAGLVARDASAVASPGSTMPGQISPSHGAVSFPGLAAGSPPPPGTPPPSADRPALSDPAAPDRRPASSTSSPSRLPRASSGSSPGPDLSPPTPSSAADPTSSAAPASPHRSAPASQTTPPPPASPLATSSLPPLPASGAAASAAPSTPPRLEILNAASSTPPHDGKLDLTLVATAHETDGTLASVDITRWQVDGQPQQDRAGHDATGTQLALTLSPGRHRVTVAGTARGLPVTYDAEVNVQIKSQGDVTVRPGAKP